MDLLERARALRRDGNLVAALPAFLAVARDRPEDPEPWYQAGRVALDLRQYPLAIRLLEASLQHDPLRAAAAHALAVANFSIGEFEAAERACRQALEVDPTSVPTLIMRGHLACMLGDPDTGRRLHEAALGRGGDPLDVDSGLALVALARGEERGWRGFAPGRPGLLPDGRYWQPPAGRVWQGEPAPGATLCVYKEGGNGDIFFFSRFIPLVAERVGSVYLTASPAHDRLLAPLPGLRGVVRAPEELPDALYAQLWSLPALLGEEGRARAATGGYLVPPETGPRLPVSDRGLRVGLTWAGHPKTPINYDRSVPDADLLRPLMATQGVEWVSLQFGHRADDADRLPFSARPQVADFGDTAHLLAQLDLVITVDTAVANLAGAMGIAAWLMAPTFPEFRWGFEPERTSWYPALRLFRRAHTREWEGVISRVAAALAGEVAARGRS